VTGARRQPVTQQFTLRALRRWAFGKPLPRGFVNCENVIGKTILRMERLATFYMNNCMSQQSLPENLKKFMVAITIRRSFGLGMRRQVACG